MLKKPTINDIYDRMGSYNSFRDFARIVRKTLNLGFQELGDRYPDGPVPAAIVFQIEDHGRINREDTVRRWAQAAGFNDSQVEKIVIFSQRQNNRFGEYLERYMFAHDIDRETLTEKSGLEWRAIDNIFKHERNYTQIPTMEAAVKGLLAIHPEAPFDDIDSFMSHASKLPMPPTQGVKAEKERLLLKIGNKQPDAFGTLLGRFLKHHKINESELMEPTGYELREIRSIITTRHLAKDLGTVHKIIGYLKDRVTGAGFTDLESFILAAKNLPSDTPEFPAH